MLSKPKILVASDFSLNSDRALLAAKELAHKTGGHITLVHAAGLPPVWDWLPGEDYRNGFFSSLAKKIDAQLKRCELKCENDVIFGDPYEELLRTIKEKKFDILVMGHGGQDEIVYIGSLAQKMISSSSIPVLIVNDELSVKKIAGLLDPAYISEKVISAGEEFSFLLSSELSFLSIVPDLPAMAVSGIIEDISFAFSDDQKEEISSKLKTRILKEMDPHSKAQLLILVSKDKTEVALLNELEDKDIDLAIVCRHNRGTLERFFIGSVSRKIVERFKGNILVIPE